jgi:diaminopimelate epimerase
MIPFVKAHACGNDFLIIEEPFAERRHADLARKLCARNTSVGADGIEFLERRTNGELFLRLFNADGSEAELSGNGTRCVAAWLAHREGLKDVALGTHGGLRNCRVIEAAGPSYLIESEMGVPRVMQRTIVVDGVGNVAGAMVNVGNPHFVILVETEDFSVQGLTWQDIGRRISTSPLFPHGTNVEFVRVWTYDIFGDRNLRIFSGRDGCGRSGSQPDSVG